MFDVLFIIVPIFIMIVFVFIIIQIISPQFRGKLMSREIKAIKYMVDESKEDLTDISTNMANATKEGIKTTTSAIKEGLMSTENIYCKYCGTKIDKDSKFCKQCGKEQ